MRAFYTLLLAASVAACGDSKFADLSDSELQDRHSQCSRAKSLAPGGAITCDNIARECERRAKDKGHNVCY